MILSNSQCANKTKVATLAYYVIGREYYRAINEIRFNAGDSLALNDKLTSQEFKDLKASYPQAEQWGLDLFFKNIQDSDAEVFWSESTCTMNWTGLACMAFSKLRFEGCDEVNSDPFYVKLAAKTAPELGEPTTPAIHDAPPGEPPPAAPPPEPVGLQPGAEGTNWWVIGGAVAIAGALIYGVTRK